MTTQFSSCTIADLLISPPTVALITALKLDGALQHLRVYGNKRGQRVRERTLHSRDNATLVTIKLEDTTGTLTATTLLVEDSWAPFSSGSMSGGITAGTSDAQTALAEIEARLRNDPTLIDVYREQAPRPPVPTSIPLTRPTTALPLPRPPVIPQPPQLPIGGAIRTETTPSTARIALPPKSPAPPASPIMPAVTRPADSPTDGDRAPGNGHGPESGTSPNLGHTSPAPATTEERPPHNCDTHGIPAVIFEEHEPPAAPSITPS